MSNPNQIRPIRIPSGRNAIRKRESSRAYRFSIADNLSNAGWSWGWVSAIDCEGRTIWIVDAHRDDGKRFVVRADEILTAFMELESVTSQGHVCYNEKESSVHLRPQQRP